MLLISSYFAIAGIDVDPVTSSASNQANYLV